ncbi:MAG: hypothetical protein L0216_14955 [Planctomycetales bacterium]|nr:hypothetical protein [Planctomycetales bacterium]
MKIVRTTAMAVAALLALLGAAMADDPKTPAETPKAAGTARPPVEALIIAFEAKLKEGGKERILEAMGTLADTGHKAVVRPLAKLIGDADAAVASGAADAVGRVAGALPAKDRSPALETLLHVLSASASRPAFQADVAKALGKTRDVRVVASLVPLIECKETAVAKAAIESLASARHESAVKPLISELTKIEWGPRGCGGDGSSGSDASGRKSSGSAGRGAGGVDDRRADRMETLREPLVKTLQSLTGKSFKRTGDWRRWWKQNKASFRVPPTERADEGRKG